MNCSSNFWIVKDLLPKMLERDEGHIVIVSSIAGLLPICNLSPFCSSKSGSIGFAESLRAEMVAMESDIKVTTACPFFTNNGILEKVKTGFWFPLLTTE